MIRGDVFGRETVCVKCLWVLCFCDLFLENISVIREPFPTMPWKLLTRIHVYCLRTSFLDQTHFEHVLERDDMIFWAFSIFYAE